MPSLERRCALPITGRPGGEEGEGPGFILRRQQLLVEISQAGTREGSGREEGDIVPGINSGSASTASPPCRERSPPLAVRVGGHVCEAAGSIPVTSPGIREQWHAQLWGSAGVALASEVRCRPWGSQDGERVSS